MAVSCKPVVGKKRVIVLDLETYSSADLAKTGVFKYVEAPDFEILLMSYVVPFGEPVQIWDFTKDGTPPWLAELLVDPEVIKVAHNCQFERACLNKALGIYSPPEQWIDTMHLAAMNGLPMTLEAAGAALQLEEQKLDPKNCLMIGNDLETDIAGARNAGLAALYLHTNLTPPQQRPADPADPFEYEGWDWPELVKVIEQL